MFKIIALFFLASSSLLFAHKINVFAYNEGNALHIKSYFTKSSPCKNCKVILEDENEKFITELFTNEEGEAAVNVAQNIIKIAVNAGSGHYEKITYQMQNHTKTDSQKSSIFDFLLKIIFGIGVIFTLFFGLYLLKRKR